MTARFIIVDGRLDGGLDDAITYEVFNQFPYMVELEQYEGLGAYLLELSDADGEHKVVATVDDLVQTPGKYEEEYEKHSST